MRPMWYGGFVPIFFIITGICSAIVTLIIFTQIAYGFKREAMSEAVRSVMENEMPKLFALAIGMVLPFVLMLSPSQRANPMVQLVAGLAVLLGLLITRYQFVVGGQIVPLFKGTWMPGFVPYVPSTTEWMLMVFAFGFVMFAYGLGEKMFKLSDTPQK